MKFKTNSKLIKKNDIFICTHDEFDDRHKYIDDAIKRKASLIVVDKNINKSGIPIIKVNDTNDTLFQMVNDYYNKALNSLIIIGITGTDGKTTTATIVYYLINSILDDACCYLGTNGFYYLNKHVNTSNTTPSIMDILKYAYIAVNNNIKYLVMEVSSEGLLHNRCKNILFDVVALTNITCDHLNIHKSFSNYLKCKLKLFDMLKDNGTKVINYDSKYYKMFKNKNKKKSILYGNKKKALIRFDNIRESLDKTIFDLYFYNKNYTITSPLVGKFNVYNLVCAISILHALGFKERDIFNNICNIKPIKGRMNFIKNNKGLNIILDYAHTTYATSSVLEFINKFKGNNKLIVVVGCAGKRYKDKRSEIGSIVSSLSDVAIFTMDDPRDEDINNIFNDMTSSVTRDNVIKIKSRKKAIKYAFSLANKNDIILILGKGCDNYMAINNKYYKYSDLDIIKRILK